MRVKIVIPDVGAVRAVFTDDWDTGTTLYEVTGPRVTGVFAIGVEHVRWGRERLDLDTMYVRIGVGRPTGRTFDRAEDREDRPVVNGVRLCGDMVIDAMPMRERRLGRWDMSVRRGRGEGPVPSATADRTAAVVHGLLTHWLTRPENFVLRLVAARSAAEIHRWRFADNVAKAREGLEEARRKLQEAEDAAAEAALFAALPSAVLTDVDGLGLWRP